MCISRMQFSLLFAIIHGIKSNPPPNFQIGEQVTYIDQEQKSSPATVSDIIDSKYTLQFSDTSEVVGVETSELYSAIKRVEWSDNAFLDAATSSTPVVITNCPRVKEFQQDGLFTPHEIANDMYEFKLHALVGDDILLPLTGPDGMEDSLNSVKKIRHRSKFSDLAEELQMEMNYFWQGKVSVGRMRMARMSLYSMPSKYQFSLLPSLLNNIPNLELTGEADDQVLTMFIANTLLGMHRDYSYSFYSMLYGQNTFYFVPPTAHDAIKPYPALHPYASQTTVPWQSMRTMPDLTTAAINEGDILFIPAGWWYSIHSPTESIGFSTFLHGAGIKTKLLLEHTALPFEEEWSTPRTMFAFTMFIEDMLNEIANQYDIHLDRSNFLKELVKSRYWPLYDKLKLPRESECPHSKVGRKSKKYILKRKTKILDRARRVVSEIKTDAWNDTWCKLDKTNPMAKPLLSMYLWDILEKWTGFLLEPEDVMSCLWYMADSELPQNEPQSKSESESESEPQGDDEKWHMPEDVDIDWNQRAQEMRQRLEDLEKNVKRGGFKPEL